MRVHHLGVLERWRRAVEQAGPATACRGTHAARSHRDLRALAHRRASFLRSEGLQAEQRVVVMLNDGVEQATWIAAAMLAGGCAVPIGLNQPERRLRELVRLARPAAVVVDQVTSPLGEGQRRYDAAHPGSEPASPPPSVHDGQAAYLCFTSGTTGRPKGVIVTHRALAHTTGEMARYLDLANRPRTHVLATSWSFDVAMMDLWLALTTGGTLFVPDRDALLGPALISTVSPIEAPIVHGTPSLFAALGDDDFDRLPESTTVMLGGESVSTRLLRVLAEHTDLHVVYGITETGVITTTHRATPETTPQIIGSALPGLECVVVDEKGEPVADGEAGELLIGGPAVGRGYLDNPAATATRFVPTDGGGRLYRTGDLVRRTAQGVFSFHGRIDQQLKIRGHRLEPAEVEQTLLSLPGVVQVAVLGLKNPAGERVVVAYVSGTNLDRDSLRQAAAARMPDWMCPAHFEILPRLPTSNTGKVDRRGLPEPAWPGTVRPDGADDSGGSATEKAIGGMWRQLLGALYVGADDNFVALGGHSLKAAQLSTALRDRLGVSVSVPDLLGARSLREMTEIVERAVAWKPVHMPQSPGPAVTTPEQRQIWLQQQIAGTAGIYNLVLTVDLRGPLGITALQRALHTVERRHPALRTCYVFDGETVTPVTREPANRPLVIRNADLATEVRRAGTHAIDVTTEVPWHYALLPRGDQHHVLLLTFHHVAVDGVALYHLLEEIAHTYSATVDPASVTPVRSDADRPRPPARYDGDEAFWTAMMENAPEPARLPGQRSAVEVADFAGWCRPVELACGSPGGLRQAAASRGGTIQALMLSSLLRVVARETGQVDLVVGVPISRRGLDVDPAAIGQFVSNLPVRFRLPRDLSPAACLDVVTRTIRQAQRNCAVDPALILKAARRELAPATAEAFHLVFAWEDEHATPVFAGMDTSWKLEFNGWSDVNLVVELSDHGDVVAGRVIGRQATSSDVDVDKLVHALEESLGELLAERDQPARP